MSTCCGCTQGKPCSCKAGQCACTATHRDGDGHTSKAPSASTASATSTSTSTTGSGSGSGAAACCSSEELAKKKSSRERLNRLCGGEHGGGHGEQVDAALHKPLNEIIEICKSLQDAYEKDECDMKRLNSLAMSLDEWEIKYKNRANIFHPGPGSGLGENEVPANPLRGQAVLSDLLNHAHKVHACILAKVPEDERQQCVGRSKGMAAVSNETAGVAK